MEKRLENLLKKLNRHRQILSKLLGSDSSHYYQFLRDAEAANLSRKLLLCRDFKTAEQILDKQEFVLLQNQSEIRHAYELIRQMEFNLSFGLCDAFQNGRLHYFYNDLFNEGAEHKRLARALIFPHENGVIDVIIPALAVCSEENPSPESRAFMLFGEAEFVACCYEKRCYVVRMVTDYVSHADIERALRKRPVKFCLSRLTEENYSLMRQNVVDFKKKLMLVYECHFNCLLPEGLGKISLADFVSEQNNATFADWLRIFQFMRKNKNFASLEQKYMDLLATVEDFGEIYAGAAKVLSRYKVFLQQKLQSEEDDIDVSQPADKGVLAVSQDNRIAFFVYAKNEGWVIECYVRNPLKVEFLVTKDANLYIFKFIKNLHDEPRLKKAMAKFSPV